MAPYLHHMHRALPVVILLLATCSNNASPDAGSREAGSGTSDPGDTTQLAQYVVGAFADSKGGLWFGTIENGVAHVKDGKISFIDSTYGLPPNGGHGIAESRDGLIWIAGHDGVYLHDPEHPGASVPDPYYGGADGFLEVVDIVERTSRSLMQALLQEGER